MIILNKKYDHTCNIYKIITGYNKLKYGSKKTRILAYFAQSTSRT